MACAPCQARRDAVKAAAKSGDVKKTVQEVAKGAAELTRSIFYKPRSKK